MSLTANFTAYINAYAAKNIEQVSAMFADDILLRDWKISVRGKPAAIAETEKNFKSAESIAIEILRTHEAITYEAVTHGATTSVAGELRIVVDGREELFVVDIVEFNSAGKIQSIRAYLGRGD